MSSLSGIGSGSGAMQNAQLGIERGMHACHETPRSSRGQACRTWRCCPRRVGRCPEQLSMSPASAARSPSRTRRSVPPDIKA